MELRPILSALARNKTGAVLVMLQIAITLAVMANAAFIINQRLEKMSRPTGVDSDNLLFASTFGFAPDYRHLDTIRTDLDALRALPGVVSATSINSIPLSGGGSQTTYQTGPGDDVPVVVGNYFEVDEHGLDTLGVHLLEGRAFREEEMLLEENPSSKFVPAVILTRDIADEIFGAEPALGRQVYDGLGQAATVVGIIDNMQGSWVEAERITKVVLHPRIPARPAARYAIRTEPGASVALIPQIEKLLAESNRDRVVSWVRPHAFFLERAYRPDLRMIVFLGILIALMTLITALGVVGLASYLVRTRTRQIGTRRAVGARRVDILRYFMVENWLLTSAGAALGVIVALACGQWISRAYALPRLPLIYVGFGIVILWVLGQLAVFVPARRAAAIPPAVATRTV
jgi:putative ABC transport system permease protein